MNNSDLSSYKCLQKSKDDCVSNDDCFWNDRDKTCSLNVIGKEVRCLNKSIHECVEPCKWEGKSLKEGQCIYGKMNQKTLVEENKQIEKEIKRLQKLVKILKHRSKNLRLSMVSRLDKVVRQLKKLKEKGNSLNLNNPKKFNKSMNTFKKIKELELKLEQEKKLLEIAKRGIKN